MLEISLAWQKDSAGYRINDYGKYGSTVVGKGGALVATRPLHKNDMVFLAFSKIKSQPDLLEFVHHYGLLEQPSYDETFGRTFVDAKTLTPIKSRPVIYGEYVNDHLETARFFRDLLAWTGRKGRAPDTLAEWIEERMLGEKLGDLNLEFVTRRGFQMSLEADSLIDGMLLQLAQKVSGQAGFNFCQLCGMPFEVGAGSDRRADSKFCTDPHRIQFNSQNRSKSGRRAPDRWP
jgi:hypothetical protein